MSSTRGQNSIPYYFKGLLEMESFSEGSKGWNFRPRSMLQHEESWQRNFWDSLSSLHSVHIPLPCTQNSPNMKLSTTNSSTFSITLLHNTRFYNGTYHFMLNFCFYACSPQHRISFLLARTSFNHPCSQCLAPWLTLKTQNKGLISWINEV